MLNDECRISFLHSSFIIPRSAFEVAPVMKPTVSERPPFSAPVYVHRQLRCAGRALWPYPTPAMLGIIALLALCLAAVCWNARPRVPEQVEKDLHAAVTI